MQTLQIFKAGKHVSASGETLEFSESDLVASAAAYDPAKHEAPIVIGHPKHDDPAYGWVGTVKTEGLSYFAEPKQIDPEFAEAVKAGKFKKISASFYAPDSPSNPVQGVYYLRHVGFLGAMPPAVKGMKAVSFAEAEEGVVDFAEIDFMDWDDLTIAGLFSNLREWMISKFDLETADRVIPIYAIDQLKMSASQEDIKPEPMDYSEKPVDKEGDTVTLDFAERESALTQREADLAKREAAIKELEFSEYCDRLIREGKVLPREKTQIVSTLVELSKLPQAIEFAEGDETKSTSLLDSYKSSLEGRAKQIEFNELAIDDAPIAPAKNLNDARKQADLITAKIEEEKAKGREISFSEAQALVMGGK